MQIETPILEKDVVDYDFTFQNGVKFPATLDENLGDYVVDEGERFKIYLAEKPKLSDPDTVMPAETAYIYKTNLLALVVRKRKQRLFTPEEQFDLKSYVMAASKTVQ